MDLKLLLEHHLLDRVWSEVDFFGIKLPLGKHLLMMWIAAAIMLVLFPIIIRSRNKKLSLCRSALEAIVVFLRDDVVIPNLGEQGKAYTPYFCTLFFFILFCNLLGMVPYGATATGNVAVTGAMALTTFALINMAGMREQGVAGYFRNICIRLFANMIAGHIVILSLIGLIFIFGAINPVLGLGVTAPVAMVLVIFVSLLEVFVAVLQAYIFTFLTAIFVGAAIHPH